MDQVFNWAFLTTPFLPRSQDHTPNYLSFLMNFKQGLIDQALRRTAEGFDTQNLSQRHEFRGLSSAAVGKLLAYWNRRRLGGCGSVSGDLIHVPRLSFYNRGYRIEIWWRIPTQSEHFNGYTMSTIYPCQVQEFLGRPWYSRRRCLAYEEIFDNVICD